MAPLGVLCCGVAIRQHDASRTVALDVGGITANRRMSDRAASADSLDHNNGLRQFCIAATGLSHGLGGYPIVTLRVSATPNTISSLILLRNAYPASAI